MPRLILVCGLPCCGKSTFIKNMLEDDSQKHISRDDIRLSLCYDAASRYSKETLVNNLFVNEVIECLNDDFDVYAEDNFNTMSSRMKFLKRIPKELYDELDIYFLDMNVSICIDYNEHNKGTKKYLNPKVIHKIADSFSAPEYIEGYDNIYIRDFHYNYYRKREK